MPRAPAAPARFRSSVVSGSVRPGPEWETSTSSTCLSYLNPLEQLVDLLGPPPEAASPRTSAHGRPTPRSPALSVRIRAEAQPVRACARTFFAHFTNPSPTTPLRGWRGRARRPDVLHEGDWMQPSRIHHVGVPVSDLDLSVAWYREALGLTHESTAGVPGGVVTWPRLARGRVTQRAAKLLAYARAPSRGLQSCPPCMYSPPRSGARHVPSARLVANRRLSRFPDAIQNA